MTEVVDVFLNTPTCILCKTIVDKGEVYCEDCKRMLEMLKPIGVER